MQRRKFIQTSLVAAPLVSLAISPQTEARTKGFVVKAGEDRFLEPVKVWGKSPNLVKISAKDTNGQLAVLEYEGLTKMGPVLHVHLKQDETFYVLEGEYLFHVGEEKHTLKAGDTIFLPRNIPHTWLQLTERGKMVYLFQPAGKMEEFFKKMNTLKGVPSATELQQIHMAHEMKVVGPPLSL